MAASQRSGQHRQDHEDRTHRSRRSPPTDGLQHAAHPAELPYKQPGRQRCNRVTGGGHKQDKPLTLTYTKVHAQLAIWKACAAPPERSNRVPVPIPNVPASVHRITSNAHTGDRTILRPFSRVPIVLVSPIDEAWHSFKAVDDSGALINRS